MKGRYSLILAFVALASCTGTGLEQGAARFVLCSRDTEMTTKAAVPFPEGTSFWFYAFNRSAQDGVAYAYPAVVEAEGRESADGSIEFPEGTRDHFGGSRMDFYGLTYGDEDGSHWTQDRFITEEGEAPRYRVERESDGSLDDLRLGVLEDMSSSNNAGRLEVGFRHALSHLRFCAARQDSPNLEGIYIKSISLWDYSSAALDLADGSWTTEGSVSELSIYSYEPSNPSVPDEDRQLTHSSRQISQCMVFPRASAGMKLLVRTYNPTVSVDHQANKSQELEQEFLIPVAIESNHEYTLSITITNKGVRIIILNPQTADWITQEQGEMNLGQPVTFGGITWADRNLGASFAPENNRLENIRDIRDWDNMRGYFYQFGRNVPYFILKNRKIGINQTLYSGFADNDYTYCISSKDVTNAPYAYLDGNSVEAAYAAASDKKWPWADVETGGGRMPLAYSSSTRDLSNGVNYVDISDYDGTEEDARRFAIVTGAANDDSPWWTIRKGKPLEGTPVTWNDVSRQPCPRGWRIPTRDDWAYIMPLSKRTGDITFNPGDNYTTGTYSYTDADGNEHKEEDYIYSKTLNREVVGHYRKHETSEDGRAWWAETGGDRCKVKIDGKLIKGLEESLGDPLPGFTTQYLCVSPENALTRGVLYAIKCVGEPEAYRIKWEFVIHNDMPAVGVRSISGKDIDIKPVTMRISRYVSNASERMTTLEEMEALDWEHPAEVMELPDCGYVYTEKIPVLVNAGNETIYACSTIDPDDGYFYAVRLKYNEFNTHSSSLSSRYLMLTKMRRAYGMCIRPVRDNSVIIK